jgi:hypothetical protein
VCSDVQLALVFKKARLTPLVILPVIRLALFWIIPILANLFAVLPYGRPSKVVRINSGLAFRHIGHSLCHFCSLCFAHRLLTAARACSLVRAFVGPLASPPFWDRLSLPG